MFLALSENLFLASIRTLKARENHISVFVEYTRFSVPLFTHSAFHFLFTSQVQPVNKWLMAVLKRAERAPGLEQSGRPAWD